MEKLKQKMASGSSRVIASLQQAATGTFQQQHANQAQQQQQQPQNQPTQDSHLSAEAALSRLPEEGGSRAVPMLAADATAHLTEEEREILFEVWRKEEQFRRDTIKQMNASRAQQVPRTQELNNQAAAQEPPAQLHNRCRQTPLSTSFRDPSPGSARSATPLSSRPASSFGPTVGTRTPSSVCSTSNLTQQQQQQAPLEQCRICRKFIGTNELCHLCSNCNQFICEDCASYSASDKHWMCSSCRRRATKPAIPADAMRELGLNQHSTPVRRMTLRLNEIQAASLIAQRHHQQHQQHDATSAATVNAAPAKTTSSASSSGCSSMSSTQSAGSATISGGSQTPIPLTTLQTLREAVIRKESASVAPKSPSSSRQSQRPRHSIAATAGGTGLEHMRSLDLQPQDGSAAGQPRRPSSHLVGTSGAELAAQVKLSDTKAPSQLVGGGGAAAAVDKSVARAPPSATTSSTGSQQQLRSTTAAAQPTTAQQVTSRTSQQVAADLRRASVAVSSSASQAQRSRAPPTSKVRKQSIGIYGAADSSSSSLLGQRGFAAAQEIQQSPGSGAASGLANNSASSSYLMNSQQQQARRQSRQGFQQQHMQQPQTMVTASSDMSVNNLGIHRRSSIAQQQMQITAGGSTTLIPFLPEQMHLRRLSDQSNLFRRSSIIADSLDGLVMARNRSHSNIDSIRDSNLFQQAAFPYQPQQHQQQQQYNCYPDDNAQSRYEQQQLSNQQLQYAPADQYQWQAQLEQQQQQQQQQQQYQQQQQQQQQRQDMMYSAQEYHHQKQQVQQQQQQQQPFASIITSYSQKQRRSSEELHSDSSSDIEEREPPVGIDYEGEPSDFFAPPRALSSAINYAHNPLNHSDLQDQTPISIPSVSVSEFRFSQQRLQQVPTQAGNAAQQHQQMLYDQTGAMPPMQVNVAIEQAIKQQMQSSQNELYLNQGYLLPRRSSSGRVLPKVPADQSRSLLDLPYTDGNAQGVSGDNQLSMLDLPVVSPTVRRASAPEGQNIKIVVDDMDGSMRSAGVGKAGRTVYSRQGDLYERLVLYRDESPDPSSNLTRGFGIRVQGGKIDEDGKLQAVVDCVLPGGPADKVGLKRGDKIIEWDTKCLVNMTFEQVAEVIEASANIAELLIKPARRLEAQPGSNYVRSQRRLSQQTERDLRRVIQPQAVATLPGEPDTTTKKQRPTNQHRMSCQYQSINMSASNLQQQRTGTGRKLPKIPGMMLDGLSLPVAEPMSLKRASTGQLDHQMNFDMNGNLLSAANDRHTAMMQNGSSPGALNSGFQVSQQQQQSAQNGYPMSGGSGYLMTQDSADQVCGLIGLQVSVDERVGQLEISILSAINMKLNPAYDYYVRVKILPESNRFKPCSTQPSCDLNWKETFIFQNFPTQQSNRMALDVSVWKYDEAPRLSTQIAQPLCEAMIPIQSARERNTDFWPLRPPASSPQTRRKSLNDLMEGRMAKRVEETQLSVGPQHQQQHHQQQQQQHQQQFQQVMNNNQSGWFKYPEHARQLAVSAQNIQQPTSSDTLYSRGHYMTRERSSSNRNLPDTSKVRGQPRRASDEVAGSSSHRLMARISPAPSRRSISVMNVGDNLSRPSSRLGSQSNILKAAQMRRDSKQYQAAQSNSGSPIRKGLPGTENTSKQGSDTSGQQIGYTPSGRRSSLVGIQSMIGYQSQKNSMSNGSDQKSSPTKSILKPQTDQQSPHHSLVAGVENKYRPHQHRASVAVAQPSAPAPTPTTSSSAGSGAGSRRGSTEHPQIQRKGSFASTALRKLKRTMSFSKASENEHVSGDQASRQGSISSSESTCELAEDLGVTRRIVNHTDFVGKLKLSFIMTKGQLEVDVLSAQGLKYDSESSLGVYVKMYLKGKTKTNKKKTRLSQPWQSPTFKQLIKYDASLVDNKSLEVSVWQKQGGLKGKVPIGFTELEHRRLSSSAPTR